MWFPCRVPDAGIFRPLWMAFQLEHSTGIVSMEKRKGLIPRRDTSRKAFMGRRKSWIAAFTGAIPAGEAFFSKNMFCTNFTWAHSREKEPSTQSFRG
jgi:hypothetical protein